MILLTLLLIALSMGLTSTMKKVCHRFGYMDIPNARSSHQSPTARLGGVAIVISFLIGVDLVVFPRAHSSASPFHQAAILFGNTIFIAGIGFVDDIRSLPYWIRLVLHIGVAGITMIIIEHFSTGNHTPPILPLAISLVGTVWIVGMINTANFMDGIDGMAAGCGVIYALSFCVIFWKVGMPEFSKIATILAAAQFGFLIFNFPPAKIFMGDVGATAIGYLLALFAVILSQEKGPEYILYGATIVFPFLTDTFITFLRRLARKEQVTAPHRRHLYQRLVRSGWSHRQTTCLYMLLSLATGTIAVTGIFLNLSPVVMIGVMVGYLVLYLIIDRYKITVDPLFNPN